MKKLTFLFASLLWVNFVFAGGLLTNTNQSAQFIRMVSRNASLGIDGVYYNPAGLIKLEDGWHFAFSSQSILQTKMIDSKFALLNDGYYEGDVKVPVFPSAYGVYKKGNLALSLGFGPVGGGGSAEFNRGLPSFEIPITKVVPALAGLAQINSSLDVQGYDAQLAFTGSSIFWGIQLGATYQVNEMVSVFGGLRYLPSKNSYDGSIQNIQLKVAGQMAGASDWLTQTAGMLSGLAAQAGAGAAGVQPLIDAGVGQAGLDALIAVGAIDLATKTQIEQGLAAIGSSAQGLSIIEIQQKFAGTQAQLNGTATQLNGTAELLADKKVETEQTGAGFTPMIGLNISPNDAWNIAVKYEMKTKLQLENSTVVDDLGLFPDGQKSNSDIPAFLGLGIGYRGLDWMEAQLSYNMYFNNGVEWGNNIRDFAVGVTTPREIEKNGYELGLGLQFNVAENIALSVGGLYGEQGVAESYQSDFSYSNPAFSAGAGAMWKISDALTLDVGLSNTFYMDEEVGFVDPDIGAYSETLGKSALSFAIGLSYSIF